MKLLLELAKKIDINARVITESEMEKIGLTNAIKIKDKKILFKIVDVIEKVREAGDTTCR